MDLSFHRLFISFHSSISGFVQGCPPLLFLNSTPLNSNLQASLLTATSADGNDEVFPVAFGVVVDETSENWRWFLTELRNALPHELIITFVSDFQRGLKKSISEIYSGRSYHAYCFQCLAANFPKHHFSDGATALSFDDLYCAAQATKREVFEKFTEDAKAISPKAYEWIIDSEPEHWANCLFGGFRYNHMTADFGQEFYWGVCETNTLSIIQVVNELGVKIKNAILARWDKSIQWETRLTPFMEKKLRDVTAKADSVEVLSSQRNKCEVQSSEGTDTLEIATWDCTCRGWVLNGLPCCHAIAVMKSSDQSPYEFCARHCLTETYHLAYANSINLVSYSERPKNDTPSKKRKVVVGGRGGLGDSVKKRVNCCSICHQPGHNKSSCR